MRQIRTISRAWVLVLGLLLVAGCAGKRTGSVQLEEKGLQNLRDRVQKAPGDVKLRLELVRAYLGADSSQAALREARRAFQLDSSSSVVRAFLGVAELRNGERQKGLTRLVEALSDPGLAQETVQELGDLLGHPYHIEQITDGSASAAFPYPSPDGTKIVYQEAENGNWDISVLDLKTGEKRRLTNSDDAEESPAFSPNGKVVAFTRARAATATAEELGQRDIYLMPVDGGSEMAAVQDSADDWYPRFSADGKKLYFVSERGDRRPVPPVEKLSDIYLLDLAKKTVARLTNNDYDDNAPNPFRGDDWLLYTANKAGHYDLYLMDLRKLKSAPLLRAGDVGLDDIGSPSVTRDGKRIAFVGTRGENYDIYLFDRDLAAPRRLTRAKAVDHAPVIDEAGNRIFFHSNRSGTFAIYAIDLSKGVDRGELRSILQEELASTETGGVLQDRQRRGRRYVGG